MYNASYFTMQTQQMVGLTLIPFSLMGVICNWMIVFVICKTKNYTHSFTFLTANQAVFEGMHALIYMFFVAPMIIFDVRWLKEHSNEAGYLILVVYDSSIQIHFVMTVNRFLAVFTPFLFKEIFNKRNTMRVSACSFASSFLVITLFFRILDCDMAYSDDFWVFDYSQQPLCLGYMNVNDLGKVTVSAIANVIIDTITIAKVNYGRRRKIRNNAASSPFLMKKEVNFLKQSFGQALGLFLGLSVYIFAPEIVDDPMRAFFFSTLFWCALHAFDGSMTILYNADIQSSFRKVFAFEKTSALLIGPPKSSTSLKF